MSAPRLPSGAALLGFWLAIALIGASLWLGLLFFGNALQAWWALLSGFLFFTPLSAGLVAWSAAVYLSLGKWPGASEKIAWAGISFAPLSVLIFIALWISGPFWTPWQDVEAPQKFWFNLNFVFARNFAGLIIVWACAFWYLRRYRSRAQWPAGLLLVSYAFVFSLLGFDFVMGLDPKWYSSMFGGYFFMTGMLSAAAAWTLIAIFLDSRMPLQRRYDFANLILAFSIFAVYLMFAQLFPIWYENLPAETRYVVPRMTYGAWPTVSAMLLLMIYLGPLMLLVSRTAKSTLWFLAFVALEVLTGMWIERAWLILPQLQGTMSTNYSLAAVLLLLTGGFAAGIALFFKHSTRLFPDLEEKL